MSYRVPWSEFIAAFHLINQDNVIMIATPPEDAPAGGYIAIRCETDTAVERMKSLLHSYQIRRYKHTPHLFLDGGGLIKISPYKFDDLPVGASYPKR